jgi:hypothetical protein
MDGRSKRLAESDSALSVAHGRLEKQIKRQCYPLTRRIRKPWIRLRRKNRSSHTSDSSRRSKRLAERDYAVSVDHGRLEKRLNAAIPYTDNTDTKTLASISSEEQKIVTQVLVFATPSDFNETTWSMMHFEQRPRITQGAAPLVARCT